jgi:hypothetical protein
MDTENPVIKLCMEGSRAEFEGRKEDAYRLYRQAWESRTDDYEACIAAHYFARTKERTIDILAWNQYALRYAEKADQEKIKTFLPSLYLNIGRATEADDPEVARHYYNLAIKAGKNISEEHGEMIENAIKEKV